jgi:CBS domain-containing protein
MKVHEVMCRPVSYCSPETSLAAAARLMEENDCGALPVMQEGRIAGVVTDRDVCLAVARKAAADTTVRQVMSANVATCGVNDEIPGALAIMASRQVRRLPVVDERGGLAGVVSMDDIILRAEEPDPSRRPPPVTHREAVETLQRIYSSRHVRPAGRLAAL